MELAANQISLVDGYRCLNSSTRGHSVNVTFVQSKGTQYSIGLQHIAHILLCDPNVITLARAKLT
jgi:hypothetical protein